MWLTTIHEWIDVHCTENDIICCKSEENFLIFYPSMQVILMQLFLEWAYTLWHDYYKILQELYTGIL